MVLDIHHHICNNDGYSIDEILPDILDTWKDEKLPPKLHFQVLRITQKIGNMQTLLMIMILLNS